MSASRFHLTKWYMDCVSPEGDARILYSAKVSTAGISLDYSSCLSYSERDGAGQTYSLRKVEEPTVTDREWNWSSEGLGCHGVWIPEAQALTNTFLETHEGSIRWTCISPKARAEVSGKLPTIRGSGYIEKIEMTIAPWRLGLTRLYWGRFIGGQDYIVWTAASGPNGNKSIFVNGVRCEEATVTSEAVTMEKHGTLTISEGVVLREGPLLQTALADVGPIKQLLKRFHVSIFERKLLSRATFIRPDGTQVTGWAIHEVVEWD